MTNGTNYSTPSSYHGYILDAQVSKKANELDEKFSQIKQVDNNEKQIKSDSTPNLQQNQQQMVHKNISLSTRLRENLNKPTQVPDNGKSLMKNISRHTLITRGFINSHFEKLEGIGNTGRLNTMTLFSTLLQVQKDLLRTLQWIQEDCFDKFTEQYPNIEKQVTMDGAVLLQDFFPPLIVAESNVLRCLTRLSFDQHRSMREISGTKIFKELLVAIEKALQSVVDYGTKFPIMQTTLEEFFKNPQTTNFFQKKQKEFKFSESLMLPLHHPSNYVQFFSEAMELLNIGNSSFKTIVTCLSEARIVETKVGRIINNFSKITSGIRAQRNLFHNCNTGILFNPDRLLIKEQDIMIYNSEKSDISFFKRFHKTKLYVFSDLLYIGTPQCPESERKIILLSNLITAHESPKNAFKFNSPNLSPNVIRGLFLSFNDF